MRSVPTTLLIVLLVTAGLPMAATNATDSGDPTPNNDLWIDPELQQELDEPPRVPTIAVLGFDRLVDNEIQDALEYRGFDPFTFEHVPIAAVAVTAERLEDLTTVPHLLSIAANSELVHMQVPPLPFWPTAEKSNFGGTGDEITRSHLARDLGVNGSGVGVAVIDLGTSGLHPGLRPDELGGPMVQNVKVLLGRDRLLTSQPVNPEINLYAENLTNSDWTDGHGTHTAGIAVGTWTEDGLLGGRAPGADLVALATGDALALLWTVAAYDWILDHQEEYNIRVTSNSYGREGPYVEDHPLNLATRAAHEAGMLVVFSAGNNGPGERTLNTHAQAPHVLAVGATTTSGAVADYSSRGDATSGKIGPDIVAPGSDIVSGRNQPVSVNEITARTPWMDAAFVPPEHIYWYRTISGTSMAAPQVAGIAALVMEADPGLGVDEVRDLLVGTTRPIVGYDVYAQGPGMVDAQAAVLAAMGKPIPDRDWVDPTVVHREGDAHVYPYHGALLASPDKGFSAFTHSHPFPVRLPSLGASVTFSWKAPIDVPLVNGLAFSVRGADGSLVERVDLSGAGAEGEHTVQLDPSTLTAHAKPRWSAAYWSVDVDMDFGAIEYDVEASVHYEGGVLPEVTHDPAPEPPGLPEREPHDPILIENDEDFTEDHGVVGGSGTEDDPYRIADWEIRGGSEIPIKIGGVPGTTAHVVIENVRLYDTSRDCLDLENVFSVTLQDSQLDGCDETVWVSGGGDLVFTRNTFASSDRGISSYGASDVLISDNDFRGLSTSGVVISQSFSSTGVVTGGPSLDVTIEGNRFEGPKAILKLITAATSGAVVRDNSFRGGGWIEFGSGSNQNRISGTTWHDGEPHYVWEVLTLPHPSAVLNTIVDAGSDKQVDGQGEVCFDDAMLQVAPPDQIEEVVWEFGDGESTRGEPQPCHTYEDPTTDHTARVTVLFVGTLEGGTTQLSDTVDVHGL